MRRKLKLTYGRFEDAMKSYADSQPLGGKLYLLHIKIILRGKDVGFTEEEFDNNLHKFFMKNANYVLDAGEPDVFYKEASKAKEKIKIDAFPSEGV